MTKKTAITWFLILGAIELALGFAGGAEYIMRKVDALDADRAAAQDKVDAAKDAIAKQYISTDVELNRELYLCQANFLESTVIYERPPQLTLGFSGIRGLPVIPIGGQGDEAPHWLIPAKIKPMVLGDSRGAVYYYMSRDNRMDGPYLPEVARPQ
ncbi:MAG: hypothetical protein LAO08_20170 [Acidobacteriia bacterium]|nr:hypothetical protein [Terriglobia bacterium]